MNIHTTYTIYTYYAHIHYTYINYTHTHIYCTHILHTYYTHIHIYYTHIHTYITHIYYTHFHPYTTHTYAAHTQTHIHNTFSHSPMEDCVLWRVSRNATRSYTEMIMCAAPQLWALSYSVDLLTLDWPAYQSKTWNFYPSSRLEWVIFVLERSYLGFWARVCHILDSGLEVTSSVKLVPD